MDAAQTVLAIGDVVEAGQQVADGIKKAGEAIDAAHAKYLEDTKPIIVTGLPPDDLAAINRDPAVFRKALGESQTTTINSMKDAVGTFKNAINLLDSNADTLGFDKVEGFLTMGAGVAGAMTVGGPLGVLAGAQAISGFISGFGNGGPDPGPAPGRGYDG